MQQLFAVMLNRGPAYQTERRMEDQVDWDAHAKFMDAFVDEGFVVLGGPLERTSEVLLIFRAASPEQIRERLAEDPWHRLRLLEIARIMPWSIRLGSLDSCTEN